MGGYLGVMAKLGPLCSRDNCSLVRGILDRLITHLLVQSHFLKDLTLSSPYLVCKSLIRLLSLSVYMRNKNW